MTTPIVELVRRVTAVRGRGYSAALRSMLATGIDLESLSGLIQRPEFLAFLAIVDESSASTSVKTLVAAGRLGISRERLCTLVCDPEEASQSVAALLDHAARESWLGIAAPAIQRAQLLQWTALGRHHESEEAAGDLLRRVYKLGQLYWPGDIGASNLEATPLDFGASTWMEVALNAGAQVEELVTQPGTDLGWSDDLAPELLDLEDAASAIMLVTGNPDFAFGPEDKDRMLAAAKLLRRARRGTPDPHRWGTLMGRLRWLAERTGDPTLALAIHPEHKVDAIPPPAASETRAIQQEEEEPLSIVAKRLRPAYRGKRLLFASNVEDRGVADKLEELLNCDVELVSVENARRVESARKRIEAGRYHAVLCTGFTNHAPAETLKGAALKQGTIFAMMKKGRPSECIRVLSERR